MRCPNCQATNPGTAMFCGQCYERFETPGPDPAPVSAPASSPAEDQVTPPTSDHADGEVAVGRFTAVDGQLVWRCAVCTAVHPVTTYTCDVCGAKMDTEAADGGGDPLDWTAARTRELVFPGLGHLTVGESGMGLARLGISVLWALGLLALAFGGMAGLLAATPLLVGLVVIWSTGPGDLHAVRAGTDPRLDARRFMYVVVGVTGGVIVLGGLGALM